MVNLVLIMFCQMIKEEVDKMRAQAEMDMYVLTNTSRNFGCWHAYISGSFKGICKRTQQ